MLPYTEKNVIKMGLSSRRMAQSIPGAMYRFSLEITILMKEGNFYPLRRYQVSFQKNTDKKNSLWKIERQSVG